MNNFQIWYKGQRVLRTIVQALIVLIPAVNAGATSLIGWLKSQEYINVDPVIYVWLNAAILGTAFVMGFVSWLMAQPWANRLLTYIGLGSAPRSAGETGIPAEVQKAVVEGITRREFRGDA